MDDDPHRIAAAAAAPAAAAAAARSFGGAGGGDVATGNHPRDTLITAAVAQSSCRQAKFRVCEGRMLVPSAGDGGGRGRRHVPGSLRATVTGVLLVELTAPHCTRVPRRGSLPLIADPIMPSRAASADRVGGPCFSCRSDHRLR